MSSSTTAVIEKPSIHMPEMRPAESSPAQDLEADQPQAGFTAINGRSPPPRPSNGRVRASSDESRNSSPRMNDLKQQQHHHHHHREETRSSHHERRESESGHKRKRSDLDASSQSSHVSHRARRTSHSSASHVGALPPITNSQVDAPPYATQEPDMHRSSAGSASQRWARSSAEESSPEAQRLVEAMQRDSDRGPTPAGLDPVAAGQPHYVTQPLSQQHVTVPVQVAPAMGTAPPDQKGNTNRKRNFANRTKTGCLTCRERKKKCDEGKPTCTNCARGGFECKGYAQTSYTKMSMPRDHQPLQAKGNGYDPYATPQPYPQPPPGFVPAPSHYPPQPYAEANGYQRPLTASREPPRHMPNHALRQEYPRTSEPWQYGPPPPPPPPPPPHSSSSHYGSPMEYIRPPPGMGPHDSPRDVKRLPPPGSESSRSTPFKDRDSLVSTASSALQHQNTGHIETEKQKMLNNKVFDPDDPTLKSDRQKCWKECCIFNQGGFDPGRVFENEVQGRFKTIIEGANSYDKSHDPKDLRVSSVGENVEVQAPFRCDYGYNIKIGSNTTIGSGCHIQDACQVAIGANVQIGTDVLIITQDGDHYPHVKRLNGQRRLARAKSIHIGDNVFIGARATIMPGVTIAPGVTIGACAFVNKDIRQPDAMYGA